MKKFTLLLLIAFLSCFTSAYAGLVTIESNFKDKNLTVGENELGWTASIVANSFESANLSRGVQFGSAKGVFTLKSNEEISKFKSITLVMSTNGSGNTMSISVVSNGTPTTILDVTTIKKANNQELTYNYTGAEPLSGIINICINDASSSVYFKKISVTYEAEDTELTAPVISGVENGKVYINEASVYISKPDQATSISYTVKKDGVAVDEATAEDAISKTYTEPGTYTVSASATDGTNTLTAEDVTFTIKSNKVTSIAEFLAIAPNYTDIDFEFDCNLIVTYVNGKYLYVRDAAGAPLLIFMSQTADKQFTEGVPVNGDYLRPGVTGKYKLYNTIHELIPTTLWNYAIAGNDETKAAAEPKVITVGAAADNMSQYVKIKNVKFNTTTEIACGEETLAVTGSAPEDLTAQYTVVGVITYSSSKVKLNVVSYEEEKVLGTPEIEVTGETNATGSYLDKATLKFVYPANATSMEYVVKKGDTVLKQAEGLTEDATLDITTYGDISIEVTAYMDDKDLKIANKTIKIIPLAPTVSLAAGTYYKTQELTITAPEGATLDGALGDETISGTTFSTTLELVAGETKKYELLVSAVKDDVSSDIVSAVYTMDGQVVAATVTGVIVTENQDENKYIAPSSNMKEGTNYTLIDDLGTEFSVSAVKNTASNLPFRSSLTISTPYLMRVYTGNVVTISSENDIKAVEFSINKTELKIDGETVTNSSKKISKEYETGTKSLTFEAVSVNTDIYSISITYAGKVHYDKVGDGAALIGMEKGKFYKVNVNLQGVKANDGVLYARTSELSAKPSEPNKDYFDKSYEDYDLSKYAQRDWVAINGLTSDYEGKEVATGFIASYDGETLTPVATPAIGDAADVTNINTFSVANVFYGNYENTDKLGMANDYRPFFVKAKLNEVAYYVGTVTKDSASEGNKFRLNGSGKCGVFEGKGVLLEAADGITLSESNGEYKQLLGVLVAETVDGLANGDVKIVALSAPTNPTGVAALKADGKATVYGTEGAVVVNGADGKVMIFDAMGRMVKSVNAEGAATVAMPAGYYIVRTAGTAAKVMVK